jgi:AraC-like DNA-binding protein
VQEQEGTVRQIELKGNDAALMEKIMKVINARIDDSNFNVEALAEEVGLSRVQLHRRVKELTGITVGEFIRNLRLQQAAKLLAAGDTTVAQVTYAVGIANPTHFSSAFKKHFGVTPSEYIAKNKKQ